jgi:hypothetical protein
VRTVDSEVDFAAAIAPQGEGRPISDRLQVQRVPARIEVQCGSNWGSGMRLLDLVRRQKVAVEVDGDVLVVTMPGTTFSISYEKSDENRLVASSFNARKRPNETQMVTFPRFLSLAWPAANAKARELGWI